MNGRRRPTQITCIGIPLTRGRTNANSAVRARMRHRERARERARARETATDRDRWKRETHNMHGHNINRTRVKHSSAIHRARLPDGAQSSMSSSSLSSLPLSYVSYSCPGSHANVPHLLLLLLFTPTAAAPSVACKQSRAHCTRARTTNYLAVIRYATLCLCLRAFAVCVVII